MNITFRRRLFFLTISIGAITTFSMVSCNNLRGNTPEIPDTSGGWVKYEGNPVLGGEEIGTCFDVNVTREGISLGDLRLQLPFPKVKTE